MPGKRRWEFEQIIQNFFFETRNTHLVLNLCHCVWPTRNHRYIKTMPGVPDRCSNPTLTAHEADKKITSIPPWPSTWQSIVLATSENFKLWPLSLFQHGSWLASLDLKQKKYLRVFTRIYLDTWKEMAPHLGKISQKNIYLVYMSSVVWWRGEDESSYDTF